MCLLEQRGDTKRRGGRGGQVSIVLCKVTDDKTIKSNFQLFLNPFVYQKPGERVCEEKKNSLLLSSRYVLGVTMCVVSM
jgi:hypothetical protein